MLHTQLSSFHLTFVDEDLVANLTQEETSRLDLGFEEWDVAGLPWWFLGNLRNNYTPRSNGSTDLQTNQVNFTFEEELFFFDGVTFLITLETYISLSENSHPVLWLFSAIYMPVMLESVSSALTSLLSAQLPHLTAYSTLGGLTFSMFKTELLGLPGGPWLWFCAPKAGGPGLIPGQKIRSHTLELTVCML